MPEKNEIYELRITDINHKGYGVGRIDGIVTFVSDAVTGETLKVKIIKKAKDYLVARKEEIIVPSPYRAESPCPVSKRCGGCVYQHITYAHELELKAARVKSEFIKAGLPDVTVLPTLSTGKTEGYRNKVECPIDENYTTGFYAERTHDIIPCDRCLLQNEIFDSIIAFTAKELKQNRVKGVRNIYIRRGDITEEIMVCIVCRHPSFKGEKAFAEKLMQKFPQVVSVILNHNPEDTNVILGKSCRTLGGRSTIDDILCGLRFTIHPLSFYQVNRDAAEMLYNKAAEMADIKPNETVVDLFCGVGTIGLSMVAKTPAKKLIGIEIVPEAVKNAEFNRDRNGIQNAEFICSPAEKIEFEQADVVILDPPRKGCKPELIDYIAKQGVPKVVYISCGPDTLARDVAQFIKLGYTASAVQPVDLFPRTGHVETVVLLSRKDIHERIKFDVNVEDLIK